MEEHPQARFIVDTLTRAGFIAYYAGGWVRDFLLQVPSDDIDIATSAPPETIQTLFQQTVPIGIAFGIVLVIVEGKSYEVATFRQDLDYRDGRRPSQIVFSTPEEDAKRRDFTINGMFYDPLEQKFFDYVGGQKDLERRLIRAIGDPHERIREDRLRMIRAVRLACRFGFTIDVATQQAIAAHASELFPSVAIERVMQELVKGWNSLCLKQMLIEMFRFGLLSELFPVLREKTESQIQLCLEPLDQYPEEAPLIVCLMLLFPGLTLEEQKNLSKTLKVSLRDQQWLDWLFSFRQLLQKETELVDWVKMYAHDVARGGLQVICASFPEEQQDFFLQEHEERIAQVYPFIVRMRNADPVVKASHLMEEGVQPGPQMGRLLKEAQRVSINLQTEDPSIVIEHLKTNGFWIEMGL